MWLHMAPVEDMMVVSEIGEQWSPHTAPARQAETDIISSSVYSPTATTIGRRMPKVPQDVPVENDIPIATANTIAGSIIFRPVAPSKIVLTYSLAPRRFVIPLKVHANVRMRIAGTIALNPSGKHSMHSSKLSTLR